MNESSLEALRARVVRKLACGSSEEQPRTVYSITITILTAVDRFP